MFANLSLIAEIKHEATNTRKLLLRVPEADFNFKPHEKSMTLQRLACHVAELTQWVNLIVGGREFDFLNSTFNRRSAASTAVLLEIFETCLNNAVDALQNTTDEALNDLWMMRKGEVVVFNLSRKIAIRNLVMNHIIHHRGQLSVYLRLLNVPVPGVYGPSADER